ncbi:MAG: guanylate kinase [Pyrinomonadaceae bacterium]|nr:guanylate kinase [Pyrinomonadaceae bacterium]
MDALSDESGASAYPSRGALIVVSSPSGGGKGTLIRRVLKSVPKLGYSVSFTTRAPREGEIHGQQYFFVSPAEFDRMATADEFLEWAYVHGNRYGTSRAQVERELSEGRDIILEIDVQGAANVRRLMMDVVSVFILPPSFEVLRARLVARGSENPADLALRLGNARAEVERYREFEYVLINDDAERAAAQLAAIIYADRARRTRQEQAAQQVLSTFTQESPQSA